MGSTCSPSTHSQHWIRYPTNPFLLFCPLAFCEFKRLLILWHRVYASARVRTRFSVESDEQRTRRIARRTEIRGGELCREYPDKYWRELDEKRAYPEAFVQALTHAGYMATLIPEEYGGPGLGVTEASVILEEIHHSGGNARGVPRADVHHGHAFAARIGNA